MRTKRTSGIVQILAVIALILCPLLAAQAEPNKATAESALPSALCQLVYPMDQFPSARGYSYIFYGNGFFINEEGYLITAGHVVSTFRNGGQPHILVGPAEGPRRLLDASLVAVDWEHDVAVLRATPNPFPGHDKIAYLPLSDEIPSQGKMVVSASLRPPDVEDAYSLDVPLKDFARSKVLDYQFHWEKGARSELLLFGQDVVPGQSGSPLVASDSQGVVGVVVGRWLPPTVVPSAARAKELEVSAGAALRIHYAISLLQQKNIAWHAASKPAAHLNTPAQPTKGYAPPVPLSVVATPYPPQAVFGGDVFLDVAIDANGNIGDIDVVRGNAPFVETVVSAVRTWSFSPARMDGNAIDGRIGIAFEFPQSFLPKLTSKQHNYDEPLAGAADRGALPVRTVEPDYPANSIAEGSVVLYELADADGLVTSTSVLADVESLGKPTIAAVNDWRFAPGKAAGAKTASAVIVVVTFRRPASTALSAP